MSPVMSLHDGPGGPGTTQRSASWRLPERRKELSRRFLMFPLWMLLMV